MIKHAAVRSINGDILVGKSHADCFRKGARCNIELSPKADDQGFVTNSGDFLNRIRAAIVAFQEKQIESPVQILFSEMLWSSSDNGNYIYVEGDGYVEKQTPDQTNQTTFETPAGTKEN